MLDGDILEISMEGEYIFEQEASSNSTRASDWVYYGVMYPNITAEKSIRLLPATALATIAVIIVISAVEITY